MSETKGRCYNEMKVSRDFPTDHFVMADAIDRLAADVASIKAKVDAVSPDDVRHFVESEKAWVRLVEEKETAAIRERDEARAEVERLRAEVERLRMQLAVCGVLADCNTTDSLERNRRVHLDYDCAAVQSVIRAVGREIALRAEVERLKAERAARQADGNRQATLDSSPAAPQPAGQGISPKVADTQPTGNAAPAPGWLTEEERAVVEDIASMIEQWFNMAWSDIDEKRCAVLRSIVARAGSPPVVEVPALGFLGDMTGREQGIVLAYRDALDAAGVPWKEVPRE